MASTKYKVKVSSQSTTQCFEVSAAHTARKQAGVHRVAGWLGVLVGEDLISNQYTML